MVVVMVALYKWQLPTPLISITPPNRSIAPLGEFIVVSFPDPISQRSGIRNEIIILFFLAIILFHNSLEILILFSELFLAQVNKNAFN